MNPNKRYIITIKNTIEEITNPSPYFYFGIMPYSHRHNKGVSDFNLCYYEKGDSYGISKMLRGEKLHFGEDHKDNMQNYWRVHNNRRFEIRIYLKDKLLRVGSLPNNELVAELSNKDNLDLSEEYAFAIRAIGVKNTTLIEDVCEVESFDDLM